MVDLKVTSVTNWLVYMGYLEINSVNGKNYKLPTEKGKEIGIYTQIRNSYRGGTYEAVLYSKKTQKFIMNNLDKIISFANKEEEIL